MNFNMTESEILKLNVKTRFHCYLNELASINGSSKKAKSTSKLSEKWHVRAISITDFDDLGLRGKLFLTEEESAKIREYILKRGQDERRSLNSNSSNEEAAMKAASLSKAILGDANVDVYSSLSNPNILHVRIQTSGDDVYTLTTSIKNNGVVKKKFDIACDPDAVHIQRIMPYKAILLKIFSTYLLGNEEPKKEKMGWFKRLFSWGR